MADAGIEKLHSALASAAAGPVTFDDAFWTAAGLTAPSGFAANLKSAFKTEALSVDYARADVGAIVDDAFEVARVTLSFLDANPATTAAVIAASAGATEATPILTIRIEPASWQLADYCPAMNGLPFSLFVLDRQRFLFASETTSFEWRDGGATIATDAGLTLYGRLAVPADALPLFASIRGLGSVATQLVASGHVDLSRVDNATVLYPDMSIEAPLATSGTLQLFFLDIGTPRLAFVIESVDGTARDLDDAAWDEDAGLLDPPDPDALGEGDALVFQTPRFGLSADLAIEGHGTRLGYVIDASIAPGEDSLEADFSLLAAEGMEHLTPATAIALVGGTSYFAQVPTVLQPFLSAVTLKGLVAEVELKPAAALSAITILIGSDGRPIDFFTDPTSSQPFTLKSFDLTFSVQSPLVTAERAASAAFDATFTLFPDLFKTRDGAPGGLFEISIDETLDFEGGFAGSVAFGDLLATITGGAIQLPDGVDITFSGIYLIVQPATKTYSLEFQVDASVTVPFVSDGDRPLIEIVDMVFTLGASTPKAAAGQSARSVYTGSVVGQIVIAPQSDDPLAIAVDIAYDGAQVPAVWRLSASLAQPLHLSKLIDQFFRAYDLPDILPGDLQVTAFAVAAVIPGAATPDADGSATTRPARHVARPTAARRLVVRDDPTEKPAKTYAISGTITWAFTCGSLQVDTSARIGLAFDGAKPEGQRYSGSVIATIEIERIGPIEIGYRFGPAAQDVADGAPASAAMPTATGDSTTLWLAWKGFRAAYDSAADTVTFSMTGWSLGSLVTELVTMIGDDPYFSLPAPWNLLNGISLDGLAITFTLKPVQTGQSRVSASYALPAPLDLGIIRITALTFKQVDGKVRLGIAGSSSVPSINQSSLFKPEGQDVTDMPKVPGRGNAFFNLRLLALGQRVKIYDPGAFNSTKDVIKALAGVPATGGNKLPFDPTQRRKGQPCYDPSSNWLAAMSFGILRIGDTSQYAFDLMIVFNDPDLYGLRLALNGDKVKVLAGLAIDILYKKITDDVGCYQIEFTLPTYLRNIDLGAFAVTLPIIGVQIYTNGDFLIDFGFPYNLDFSRSFTAQGIIMGVPVLGSAGFYFGKLSNATAPGLPLTTKGTFHPVIVFGLGVQLGVGKTIDKGVLKAGFMITVFGIIEGTIAAWHPYQSGNSGNAGELQGDYYFKLSGSFGLIGKLYGTVDFAVVKADVSLTVRLVAAIAYESFRRIPLSLSASVDVKVSVSIDCGLFSIDLNFSFSTRLQVELTIGQDQIAPWDGSSARLVHRSLHALGLGGPVARIDWARPRVLRTATLETLKLTAVPQFTVLAPDDGTAIEGAFVLGFVMDAPAAGDGEGTATSFGKLCAALLQWLIAGVDTHPATTAGLPAGAVSRPQLEALLVALADPARPPFDADQVVAFLAAHFTIDVAAGDATTDATRRAELGGGTAIFPAIPALHLAVPDPRATSGDVTIDLARYATATASYEATIREIFAEVAARVADETGGAAAPAPQAEAPRPLAACVLTDYMLLLARQLVQSAIDAFDDYAYPLDATTSLDTILAWAAALMPGQLSATALVEANLLHLLAAGKTLAIGTADQPLRYLVQTGDSMSKIAARYAGTTAAALILSNQAQNNLVVPGSVVTIGAASYTTRAGDGFATIAAALGVTIDALAANGDVQARAILTPAVALTIPDAAVTTAEGDTIQALLQRFNVPLAALLGADTLAMPGLFAVEVDLRFAVPALAALPEAALWPAIVRTGTLGHIAGMASRYMLHGVRLPVATGLALPPGFLYGTPRWPAQSAYGLYQLTGQQFPLAETNPGTAVTLSRPASGYDWLRLGGGASLTISLAGDASTLGPRQLLERVLTNLRGKAYAPRVDGPAVEPAVTLAPKRYATGTFAAWSSSDVAGLVAATTPAAGMPRDTVATPQVKPILWALSSALMQALEARQRALAALLPQTLDQRRYMPVLVPEHGTRDPATTTTHFTPLAEYALATRIDFKVKHLAQDVDLAPQTPGANDIVPPGDGNPGSAARALAPFAYEVVGPSAADAVLLERLLTAMSSEGERIVGGMFLAYADANDGTDGLVSRAPSEFLAFLVQSNLSTETNPAGVMARAVETADAPHGIANGPADFIKLLWELSTVNSGGTYLFFQLLKEAEGLPPALFDASGLATLTLVVTHAREAAPSAGTRMSNAMNALLTTTQIDPHHEIVDLTGLPSPVPSLAVDATMTPRGLAAAYGLDLGDLARANPDAPLRAGSDMPVGGLYRQLTAADMAKSDPLEALATYYSIGAVTPITRAAIAAFNPGVAIAALALFRIPPLTYKVASTGPGATLAAIAAYYAADATALLHAARDVAGLFSGPTVSIDPQAFDAQVGLGLGNAGLTFTRERGDKPRKLAPDAPPADVEAYARATMLQLYQLASARIAANQFFTRSVDSAAFGPRERGTPGEAPRAARRLAMPLSAGDPIAPYFYEQALGYRRGATVNAAPGGDDVPPAADNPYRGIGSILQFQLAWQDLFGNRCPGAFGTDPAGMRIAGTLPAPLLYADRPIPLDQWPSTSRAHRWDGTAGAPVLHIDIHFDPTPYNPATTQRHAHLNAIRAMDELPVWQRTAIDDLARFTLVYFQLVQDYSGLGIPGLDGPAMTIGLHNSLLAAADQPLAASERSKLIGFVSAAIRYLTARAAATAATAPADIDLTSAVDPAALVAGEDIIAIAIALDFIRDAALVAPALRGISGGCEARSLIPAFGGKPAASENADDTVFPVGLEAYAAAFEAAFVTTDWRLRLGTGAADPGAPTNARADTLWAVRLAVAGGTAQKGIDFEIGGAPIYYAPLPIAATLQTLQVDIAQYKSGAAYPDGSALPTTFTSVDPNTWLAECLTALDDFLAATYATPCFVLDRLAGTQADGYLARLLDHKKTLAGAIAATVRPVLAQDDTMRAAARDKLEQALLRRLDTVATLACVAVLPVSKARYAPHVPATSQPPRLFGQPVGTLVGTSAKSNDNFALSTGKIQLQRSSGDDTSALAFLVTSHAAERQAYVELDLAYAISNLEHDIHGVPGIDKYEQSRWISFPTGAIQTAITPTRGTSFAIPVALRSLPTPATIVAQTGTAFTTAARAPADLKSWTYSFSYLLNQAAQDSVLATVEFNLPGSAKARFGATPENALYAALAQFVAISQPVARDLESFLRPIEGTSVAGSTGVVAAGHAVAAFETVIGEVAAAYDAWAKAQGMMARETAAPPRVTYVFEIALDIDADDDTSAIVHIRPQFFLRDGAAVANILPLAEVRIDDANYRPELIGSDRATGAATWRYRRRAEADPTLPELLPYETARLDPSRQVVFAPLDILALQSAWSAVQVVRNRHLAPPDHDVATSPSFEFKSAPSRFADPIVPFLDYANVALDGDGTAARPVTAWLTGFFETLLDTGDHAQPVTVGIETVYSYGQTADAAVPLTRLPVGLLPPTGTNGATDPPLVGAVATVAQDFLDDRAPRTGPRAGFDFGVTIFAAAGDRDMPLLRIGALTLAAARIAPG